MTTVDHEQRRDVAGRQTDMTGVHVTDLYKEYATPGEPLVVLRGVNLSLSPGEAVAVVGPSGSGKSTLLNIMGTLDSPTRGQVRLDGTDPFALSVNELAKFRGSRVGFIFQDHHLLPQCTALENVLVARLAVGRVSKEDSDRAAELLCLVGIEGRATHRPAELSGGERQRVAIARALMNKPSLLLCDEPTGNLDPATSLDIVRLLDRINRTGTTIVMATHDDDIVNQLRKRVVELVSGHIVRDENKGVYGSGR